MFSKKKWKEQKKNKNQKNAKSQFWLRRTRKVDATGLDFGCKFRLRRSPGASESVFWPILARFLANFHFFHIFWAMFCIDLFWYDPFFRQFLLFAFGVLISFFYKNVFFVFLMKNTLWGHVACSWHLVTSGHKIICFPFLFVALSGGFYKNAFFHFFDEESVLVTCGVLWPCSKGKARSGPSGAHRGSQRPVWLHRALVNSHFCFFVSRFMWP